MEKSNLHMPINIDVFARPAGSWLALHHVQSAGAKPLHTEGCAEILPLFAGNKSYSRRDPLSVTMCWRPAGPMWGASGSNIRQYRCCGVLQSVTGFTLMVDVSSELMRGPNIRVMVVNFY